MSETNDKLREKRDFVLSCEIGALLHLAGKSNSDYLEAIVENEKINDQNNDHIKSCWDLSLSVIPNKEGGNKKCSLEKYIKKGNSGLSACHKRAGAEEKGSMTRDHAAGLMSPFGGSVREKFADLVDDEEFKKSVNEINSEIDRILRDSSLQDARERLLGSSSIVKEVLSRLPGESRKPCNDLSVWDQSLAVAALYKSMAARYVIAEKICSGNSTEWRLLVVKLCRRAYLAKCLKIHDVIQKQDVIEKIAVDIRKLIECEAPVGNLVFAKHVDGWLNLVFTFPDVGKDKIGQIIDGYAERIRQIAGKLKVMLGYELPLEIGYTNKRRLASECLSDLDNLVEKTRVVSSLKLPEKKNTDLCPVCRLRQLNRRENSECKTCRSKREKRFKLWNSDRIENTIWISELADSNNKIALLTFSLNADKWLSGEWFSTICTQRELGKPDENLSVSVIDACSEILSCGEYAANYLGQLLPGVKGINQNGVKKHLEHLAGWYSTNRAGLDKEKLATRIGTVNPSTGRLMRAIKELDQFSEECMIRLRVLSQSGRRIFSVKPGVLSSKSDIGSLYKIKCPSESKRIQAVCIAEDSLAVIEHLEEKQIEWLDSNKVINLIRESDSHSKTQSHSEEMVVEIIERKSELFKRLICLSDSPSLSQVLVPADMLPKAISIIDETYTRFFGFVRGKLPLNIGIAVSKRKYPLYSLLDAGERMVDSKLCREGQKMSPWWKMDKDQNRNRFYGYYPQDKPDDTPAIFKYSDLVEFSESKEFWLTPGYTDFCYFTSTSDVNKISYNKTDSTDFIRLSSYLGWQGLLPVYTHIFVEMISKLKGKFSDKKGLSSLRNLESILHEKILSLELIPDDDKADRAKIFTSFFDATLSRYGSIKLDEIPGKESQEKICVLLNALHFFLHVIR